MGANGDGNGGTGKGSAAAGVPLPGLRQIGAVLEEAARQVRAHAIDPAADLLALAGFGPVPELEPRWVRALIDVRALCPQFVGLDASDPALILLLELYAARLERRAHDRAPLAAAVHLSRATAARRAARLEAAGHLVRLHPLGARRPCLGLTDATAENLRAWLAAAAEIAGAAV